MDKGFATHANCLVCGSTNLSAMPKFAVAHLVRCADCSLVFSERRASGQELEAYYNLYPRDTNLSPITRRRYTELVTSLEGCRKTNNLLDIGCGDGHFLAIARERGWNVFGTEYTDDAIAVCERKGITMRKGRLSQVSLTHNYFDVVTSFEVIEHIDDPRDEASAINNLLRPGGNCLVTTPNFNSMSRYLLGSSWNVIGYPEHLCYYNKKALQQLFQQAGLDMQSVATTGISLDRFRTAVRSKSQDPSVGMDESFRNSVERSALLNFAKRSANFILSTGGVGDTLKVNFRKS